MTSQLTGRHTGTGSARLSTALPSSTGPQPPLTGYIHVPLLALLKRTGALPPHGSDAKPTYRTLREARRKAPGPVVLFPEGTTSNGRALLRFGEGVLADGDVASDEIPGRVWVKFFRCVAFESRAFMLTLSADTLHPRNWSLPRRAPYRSQRGTCYRCSRHRIHCLVVTLPSALCILPPRHPRLHSCRQRS